MVPLPEDILSKVKEIVGCNAEVKDEIAGGVR
jgi:hypothetical protein